MLYINCLTVLFILIFNYKLLLYIGCCYLFNMMVNYCIEDGYWLNSTDMYLRLFGNCIYIFNYIIYIYRDSYIILTIKNAYNTIYINLSNVNTIIDIAIKKNIFNILISKSKKEIINDGKLDIEVINILQSNLKLIIHIENLKLHNSDNELEQLLNQSKIKINSYIKKYKNKPKNSILDDIKKYNK